MKRIRCKFPAKGTTRVSVMRFTGLWSVAALAFLVLWLGGRQVARTTKVKQGQLEARALMMEEEMLMPGHPGGVSTNLTAWFKADVGIFSDEGITPAVEGTNNVRQWNDQSGNTAFATNQPGRVTESTRPDFVEEAFNFNPGVSFTGNERVFTPSDILSGDLRSGNGGAIYAVFNTNNTNGSGFAVYHDGTTSQQLSLAPGGGRIGNSSYLNFTTDVLLSPGLVSLQRSTSNSGTTFAYLNGVLNGTVNDNDNNLGNDQFIIGGGSGNSDDLNGIVSEVIVFSDGHDAATHNLVESYLALKYGITKIGDYVSSTDAVVWDSTANAGFNNAIFGISKDQAGALDQLKSKSMAANGGQVILEAESTLDDQEFLIVGNNGEAFKSRLTDVPTGYAQRSSRVWKTQVTGDPGAMTVQVFLDTITVNDINDLALLIDSDTDFSNATAHTTGRSLNAGMDTVTFTGVTLTDGQFFTLTLPEVTGGDGSIDYAIFQKSSLGSFNSYYNQNPPVHRNEPTGTFKYGDFPGDINTPNVTGNIPVNFGSSPWQSTGFQGEFLQIEGYLQLPCYSTSLQLRSRIQGGAECHTSLHLAIDGSGNPSFDGTDLQKVSEEKRNFSGNEVGSFTEYTLPNTASAGQWIRFGLAISDGTQNLRVTIEMNVDGGGWENLPVNRFSSLGTGSGPLQPDPACIDFSVSAVSPTCTNMGTANSDGQIVIAGDNDFERAAFSIGSVYNGPDYNMATTISGSNFTLVDTLSNPLVDQQPYIVRAWEAGGANPVDYLVVMERNNMCIQADLEISVTPLTVTGNVGEIFTYDFVLTNNGPDDAPDVVVELVVPANAELLTTKVPQGQFDALTNLWTVGTVANGATLILEVTVKVKNPN